MRARTFLLILLALVLWGRGVQGRGSTETWVSPCTLDVVLVTFKDTTGRPNAPDTVQLDYHTTALTTSPRGADLSERDAG